MDLGVKKKNGSGGWNLSKRRDDEELVKVLEVEEPELAGRKASTCVGKTFRRQNMRVISVGANVEKLHRSMVILHASHERSGAWTQMWLSSSARCYPCARASRRNRCVFLGQDRAGIATHSCMHCVSERQTARSRAW